MVTEKGQVWLHIKFEVICRFKLVLGFTLVEVTSDDVMVTLTLRLVFSLQIGSVSGA